MLWRLGLMRGRRSGFNSNQLLINQSLIRPQALITVDCHPESAEYILYIYDYRRRRGSECSLQNKNHWLNYDLILKVRILSFPSTLSQFILLLLFMFLHFCLQWYFARRESCDNGKGLAGAQKAKECQCAKVVCVLLFLLSYRGDSRVGLEPTTKTMYWLQWAHWRKWGPCCTYTMWPEIMLLEEFST